MLYIKRPQYKRKLLPTFASEGLFSKEIPGLQRLRYDVSFPDELLWYFDQLFSRFERDLLRMSGNDSIQS